MQVQDIMTKNPVCCVPATPVSAIARLMCEHKCGAIPIVKDLTSRLLVGVVTTRDLICRVLATGENPQEKTARDCLSSSLVTIAPEASVEECCRAMEHSRIRRILVVDAQGACCGIVSLDDIAYWQPNQTTATVTRAVMPVSKGEV